ncbi:MAG: hypothetical protein JXA33_22900 [Anaerolineae bacterium]|nr:hypothetical protein [Anaerolineae bacterium]
MSLEGLQAILSKEEIVATQRAIDLLERPEAVDEAYKRHVRTYVPLGRQAENGQSGQSVAAFERQIIQEVQQGGAVRGYLTAEYGYGKTSTALYLWERARAANILVTPPFQLNRLTDLLVGCFGWAHYEIGRTRPNLVGEAKAIYQAVMERNAQTLASQYNIDVAAAQRMAQDKPEILDLGPNDYINFFEEMTHLAQRAGFEGLLLLADEVQQYIEPEIKSGVKDPISPLFDVIGAILTRRGHLNFGLIMVIPPKEIGLMRDIRGDLIHRVLQVSLDLSTVYDREFPGRLWQRLAKTFDFEEHQARILSPECLDALGQISSRQDLADGPRTVVNVFRRATRRYIEMGYPPDAAYTPGHLIEDFMGGQIQYDSPKKIPQIVSQALTHSLVRGQPERERAIKWAAAFPNEGLKRTMQEQVNLRQAFDDLSQSAQGDLIISVGDVRDPGFTLRGLDQVQVNTEWLPTTIREFWRSYYETADPTKQRALKAFQNLLTQHIFPSSQWTMMETIPDGLTRNLGLVLEGHFNGFARKFPKRRVHVRILWEDDIVRDANPLGDVVVQIRLRRYLDVPEEERRRHAEPLQIDYATRQITLTLNLMYREEGVISPTLERIVAPIVSPYKLTPLLLLTMHETMEAKRADNLIPKPDDPQVQYFQSDLLDNVFRGLFNAAVGVPVEAAQERLIETALLRLLDAIYPEYDTLMRVSNWESSLTKYVNAIKHLETAHERQGQIIYEGMKEDVATLFTFSNTGLDAFISNFPALIEIVQDFPTRREAGSGSKGAVRFKLHPLEQKIRSWIEVASATERIQVAGRSYEVHLLSSNDVYRRAEQLGYREKEIDATLDLMMERGLLENDSRRGIWRETVSQAPSIDELTAEIQAWQADLDTLLSGFPESAQLKQWREAIEKAREIVNERLKNKPDDEQLIRLRRSTQAYHRQLQIFAGERQIALRQQASRMLGRIPMLEHRQGERLNAQVQGGVDYVLQINDLRTRILRQYTALENETQKIRHEIEAQQAELKTEDLGLLSLARLSQDLKAREQQLDALKTRCEAFSARYDEFAAWVDLVERGSALQEQIQQLGDLVREPREQFQRLSQDINGHISADKEQALPHSPTYKLRLDEIAIAVREVREASVQRFAQCQERYQQALIHGLKFPADRLWRPLQYNPLAPEDSYERLYDAVRDALLEMRERLVQAIAQDLESIGATLVSPYIQALAVEEREGITQEGHGVQEKLTGLNECLHIARKQLGDRGVLTDFPTEEEGKFHKLLQLLEQVNEQFLQTRHQVEILSRKLREVQLTGPEEAVMQTFSVESNALEVSALWQQQRRLAEDEFWVALRGLHAKRRVRITVEPIRYD